MSHVFRRSDAVAALIAGLLGPVASGQTAFVNWETPHVSPLALTPSGSTLLAVNTADDRLEVFDVSSGAPVRIRSIPVGLDPVCVRARTETEVWVVNQISDSISIIDLATGRVTRTLLTADEPADVVFAGSPQRAFVSISQLNQVVVYDLSNLAAAPTVIGIEGEDPRALAVDAGGTKVFAAIFESGNKTTLVPRGAVSVPAGPYAGQNPPPTSGNAFSPPIAAGLTAPPPVGQIVRQNGAGQWMDDNNHNWSAFINWGLHDHDVAIIDASTLGVTYASGLMTTVAQIAVAPDGSLTAVGMEAINEKRFEPNVKSIFIRSQMASFSPAAPASGSVADLNPHLNYSVPSVAQATRDLSIGDPRAIVWNGAGDKAYVSGMGSNNVVVTDHSGARVAQINVGQGPTGLAMGGGGTRLFVLNRFDASISTIDTASNAELSRVAFFDPTPSVIKLGRPFLYNTHTTSGLGQASCASCHVDARTDHLGWDLGDPSGAMKAVDATCRQGPGNCQSWHPMKGPMVTQTLVGIVGDEPLHWRGDRENVAAFGVAFTGLQGADAQPSATELQQLTDFVATLRFPPNPNRNLDSTLRTSIATTNGTGNAATGQTIFTTQPVLPGGLTCNACHALPKGTDRSIDFPAGAPSQQSLKVAQLRNMYDKTGMNKAILNGSRGFGFDHDGTEDSLFAVLNIAFNFPPGPPGVQQRRDVEAFLLSLSTDTHPAVGQQITFDGTNNSDPTTLARLNTFIALADAGQVGLMVKGRQQGLDRGYMYLGSNVFQSDRLTVKPSAASLLASATAGSELTYTVVPIGTQRRIGVDRDADGALDRDEIDRGYDPADPLSIPPACPADLNGDGTVGAGDLAILLGSWAGAGAADLDGSGVVTSSDLALMLGQWGTCS